ncbi:DUF2461 domain-containing protein [Phytoactinopolyspora halotolerans]|uniref:DUF2461 domain-containing protein n=2 Tax=Phytoactinopolyspora halotolerans TaxID=1981512 RepID=A0A6L9SBB2_9ACTN|nr:DUF2461 domain-containing protein [Phytoactinopolyspora halotolerans]
MAFHGWPAEALEFYEGLEADNSRTYWTAHKHIYDRDVRGPMVELLTELEPEFGEGKIFRPNRDVRFSADKSPYKTTIAATLDRGGYVQLSADGLAAGSGIYMMDADQLSRYRHAVDDDETGDELRALVDELIKQDVEVTAREYLKTAPRGYAKDHPRVELLRHKGIIAWRHWPAEAWLGTSAAKDTVVEFLRLARPLNDWLAEYVA